MFLSHQHIEQFVEVDHNKHKRLEFPNIDMCMTVECKVHLKFEEKLNVFIPKIRQKQTTWIATKFELIGVWSQQCIHSFGTHSWSDCRPTTNSLICLIRRLQTL